MSADLRKNLFRTLVMGVVLVWGASFVSSKVLLEAGLDTIDILLASFLIAYLAALALSYRRLWADSVQDEIIHLCCGLTGGTLFYVAQAEALKHTLTTNVSILVSAAPILTAAASFWVFREQFTKQMLGGSALALLGAVLVVFNGKFELDAAPMGNLLGLGAALAWAGYSVLLKLLGDKYPVAFTIRKVFFYGTLGLLLYALYHPVHLRWAMLATPLVMGNILFLGLVSSMGCYVLWSLAVIELGPTQTAAFMYVLPGSTLLLGYFLLGEPIRIASVLGLALIVAGVYLTEKVAIPPPPRLD